MENSGQFDRMQPPDSSKSRRKCFACNAKFAALKVSIREAGAN